MRSRLEDVFNFSEYNGDIFLSLQSKITHNAINMRLHHPIVRRAMNRVVLQTKDNSAEISFLDLKDVNIDHGVCYVEYDKSGLILSTYFG